MIQDMKENLLKKAIIVNLQRDDLTNERKALDIIESKKIIDDFCDYSSFLKQALIPIPTFCMWQCPVGLYFEQTKDGEIYTKSGTCMDSLFLKNNFNKSFFELCAEKKYTHIALLVICTLGERVLIRYFPLVAEKDSVIMFSENEIVDDRKELQKKTLFT